MCVYFIVCGMYMCVCVVHQVCIVSGCVSLSLGHRCHSLMSWLLSFIDAQSLRESQRKAEEAVVTSRGSPQKSPVMVDVKEGTNKVCYKCTLLQQYISTCNSTYPHATVHIHMQQYISTMQQYISTMHTR